MNIIDEDLGDLDTRALSTIWLYLEGVVLFNIIGEETVAGLWSRMEGLYMTKSLTK